MTNGIILVALSLFAVVFCVAFLIKSIESANKKEA